MLTAAVMKRMLLAGALTTGVGGAATTVVPGMEHWSPASVVMIVAAVTALGGVLRKVLTLVFTTVTVTAGALIVDMATGGKVQNALNLGHLLSGN